MKLKYIIFGLLIFVLLFFFIQNKEHAGSTPPSTPPLSSEAIQNIAKVYADTNNTATFNNVTITGDLTVANKFNIIPRGTIVAFNSATAPAGWAICDGTNGTPDLRGRFILGTGKVTGANLNNTYNGFGEKSYEREYNFFLAETGGSNKHTLTVNEIPEHTHSSRITQWGGGDADYPTGGNWGKNLGWTPTTKAGGSQPHNNVPPYYALTYIMKL